MVTLYDVARRAGVSIATVSRVLHGQEPVRETTRARVRAAIEELGYVPDGAAQSLARSRKDVIGLVCVEHTGLKPNQYDIESMSLLFYDEVMRGVEARIRELSWSLLITFLREDENSGATLPEDEPVHSRLLALSGKVDGLLIGEGVVPPAGARPAGQAGSRGGRRRRHGAARRGRGVRGQLVRRARARRAPGRRPRQAPAVPRRRPGDRAGRHGAAARHAGGHRRRTQAPC